MLYGGLSLRIDRNHEAFFVIDFYPLYLESVFELYSFTGICSMNYKLS